MDNLHMKFYSMRMLFVFIMVGSIWFVDAKYSKPMNKNSTAKIFVLKTEKSELRVTNYGATIVSFKVPDSKGKMDDVVLGYDNLKGYLNGNDGSYIGAIVGRVANRIKGAQFTIDGKLYHISANEGKNTLHGGKKGFDKMIWGVEDKELDGKSPFIQFVYHSYDGEEGFPGAVDVYVKYTLMGSELRVRMKAIPKNKATPINLAQHTYWNIAGQGSGRSILGNKVQIMAHSYTPVDKQLIPTGSIASVKNTPYDFTMEDIVGSRIDRIQKGYDINYVLDKPQGKSKYSLSKVAIVKDDWSGRSMELWSDAPGVQFYTAGSLGPAVGKGGNVYISHSALCLETQHFPDSVHHPNFPSTVYKPGQVYRHTMVFKFSTYKSSCMSLE